MLCVILPTTNLSAQEQEETYDLVYLGDKQGYIKGKITNLRDKDGYLVIEDKSGRVYTLGREDYEFYKRDIPYKKKRKKKSVKNGTSNTDSTSVRPRKENEFEVTIGISPYSVLFIDGTFDGTTETTTNNTLMTLIANVGVGKYFGRQHFLGVIMDYAILPNHYFGTGVEGKMKNYLAIGPKYKFQYDGYKRNTAWFLSLNGKLNMMKGELYHQYETPWGGTRGDLYFDEKHTTVSIGLGQGVAFILNNKKSINLELSANRHFGLQQTVFKGDNTENVFPLSNRSITGITLSLMYNL